MYPFNIVLKMLSVDGAKSPAQLTTFHSFQITRNITASFLIVQLSYYPL